MAAQRPRASSSRSPAPPAPGPPVPPLLNARGRHRLDRNAWDRRRSRDGQLLNARGRHRLDRAGAGRVRPPTLDCSTPEGVIVSIARRTIARRSSPIAAQRPRASSSRSQHRRPVGLPQEILCSTPEGVIVSIARSGRRRPGVPSLLNARGRHRLDREVARLRRVAGVGLLNARGRHRLDRMSTSAMNRPAVSCSTPEGVIVSIAGAGDTLGPLDKLLNARGRHRLDRVQVGQPLRVDRELLNARGRHRLDRRRRRYSWPP